MVPNSSFTKGLSGVVVSTDLVDKLRLRVGDAVQIFDGQGNALDATIGAIEGNTIVLTDPQGLLRNQNNGEIYHEMTQDFIDIARLSTIVKANELETKVVTGIDPRVDPESAVKALYQFGCKIAVTTIAEAGSIIYDGEGLYTIPAYQTNAIDPTGEDPGRQTSDKSQKSALGKSENQGVDRHAPGHDRRK